MPITQARVKEIVDAGQDFRTARTATVSAIRALATRLCSGELSPDQFYSAMETEIVQHAPSEEAAAVLARELEHYRLTAAPNMLRKNRQRQRRGGELSPDQELGIGITSERARDLIAGLGLGDDLGFGAAAAQASPSPPPDPQATLLNEQGPFTNPTIELTPEELAQDAAIQAELDSGAAAMPDHLIHNAIKKVSEQ